MRLMLGYPLGAYTTSITLGLSSSSRVGVLLSFPGVTYLTALHRIARLDVGAGAKDRPHPRICLIHFLLLEVPLLSYTFAPEWTNEAVTRFRSWLARRGRGIAIIGTAALGALLVTRGVVGLV